MIKIFFDVETTGLDYRKHSIHQLAGLIEVDDVIVRAFDFKVRPHPKAQYDEQALRVCGVTQEELQEYPPMKDVHKKLVAILGAYIDRFDKTDKAYLAGYNNRSFDDPFLRTFFELCADKFFGAWFWPNSLDVMVLATEYLLERRPGMPSFKLHRVATELGLEVDKEKTHEASYDVMLTRGIYRIVTGKEIEL